MLLFLLFLVPAALALEDEHDRCTAIIVEKSGSADGATMTTHTNDCKQCDFRIAYVPPADYGPDARRAIYEMRAEYPRFVGRDSGPVYYPENVDTSIYPWDETPTIGYIPQVSHTYGYIDGAFPIMNEKQVVMGESTCSGKLLAVPVSAGGGALLDMSILTRIAFERCDTARCAIKTMGALAEKYGYYGADWNDTRDYLLAETGEAMTVGDKEEAWVFHILPDDSGTSAVWVAQRVPKGHISVLTNEFTIKEIDLSDTENFLASSNVIEVAIRNNFYNPDTDGAFNFQRAYTYSQDPKHYSSRRQWRLLSLAAPSLGLDPNASIFELPFSVKVERPLTRTDLMNFQRDHFEGTPYDQTQGMQSGPFGNPNRYDRGDGSGTPLNISILGQFERSISIFRASFSYVTESRNWLPDFIGARVWFGHYAPHATAFVPLYPIGDLPPSLSSGSLHKFSRDSSFWAFCAVGNWANLMYKYIIGDIQNASTRIEQYGEIASASVEKHALRDYTHASSFTEGRTKAVERLLTWEHKFMENVMEYWWSLFDLLITKWHDNYRVDGLKSEKISPKAMFYPQWWLEQVGYFNQSILDFLASNNLAASPTVLLASTTVEAPATTLWSLLFSPTFSVFFLVIVAAVSGYVGAAIGSWKSE